VNKHCFSFLIINIFILLYVNYLDFDKKKKMSSAVSPAKTSSSSSSKVASSASTARPSLKNLTRARVPRAGLIGTGFAIVSAIAWKVLVSDAHKREISAFYK